MARVPEQPNGSNPWAYDHPPADPPHLECYVGEKEPPPVLYGPKGHPLPPSRPPDRFGFQSRKREIR